MSVVIKTWGASPEGAESGGTGGSMWRADQDAFLEAMGEAGKSVVDALDGQIVYINVMNRLSVDCDCKELVYHGIQERPVNLFAAGLRQTQIAKTDFVHTDDLTVSS